MFFLNFLNNDCFVLLFIIWLVFVKSSQTLLLPLPNDAGMLTRSAIQVSKVSYKLQNHP